MSETNSVGDDKVISLDYTLRLDDGEIVDSSSGREPLEFIQGQGQIIPGLEQELYGMEVGDEKAVTVTPEDGYGERQADRVQTIPRDAFPDDMELEQGMQVRLQDSNSGQVFEAFVEEIHPESVKLDFNHPLAGETLYFDVKIAGVREATDDELSHGHAH